MSKQSGQQEIITPQPGPQTAFLEASCDITIYGGAAGGGKSYALELEPLYHIHNPEFNAVFFRRTIPQIRNPGGLWDESFKIYPKIGGVPNLTDLTWVFGGKGRGQGAYLKFASLQYDSDVYNWQGSQIPLLLFDELTHFTEQQFFYMLSRNRSVSGVRPYVRATTNPDASSWVKRLIAPWVDFKFPAPARSGEIRHFIRSGDRIEWVAPDYIGPPDENIDDPIIREQARIRPKSITFIAASIYDNKKLLAVNPEYLTNLMALPLVERQRLLFGDWDIMPEAGKVFNRNQFRIIPYPLVTSNVVRFWDFAATEKEFTGKNKNEPDFTVGLKMGRVGNHFIILDVIAVQAAPGDVDELVAATAHADGYHVPIRWEIEPGSGGKMVSYYLTSKLQGFDARGVVPRGDKIQRSRALASQTAAGNISVVQAAWNENYLTELHHFPTWKHDDQVDASSGAYNYLISDSEEWNENDLAALSNTL